MNFYSGSVNLNYY